MNRVIVVAKNTVEYTISKLKMLGKRVTDSNRWAVAYTDNSGLYGYVDTVGNTFVNPQFSDIMLLNHFVLALEKHPEFTRTKWQVMIKGSSKDIAYRHKEFSIATSSTDASSPILVCMGSDYKNIYLINKNGVKKRITLGNIYKNTEIIDNNDGTFTLSQINYQINVVKGGYTRECIPLLKFDINLNIL